MFGLPNRVGLSSLFTQTNDNLDGTCQANFHEKPDSHNYRTAASQSGGIAWITKDEAILGVIQQTADIVLIDTPPTLAVTDAAVLAPTLDGVLIVVRPGKTRASALQMTIEQFKQVNARIVGIVLNDIDLRGKPYAYRYHYYKSYATYQNYYEEAKKEEKK
jgi:non-specific protein-tyrosine kinase